MTTEHGRQVYDEQFKDETVRALGESGMTLTAFARVRGIPRTTLWDWKHGGIQGEEAVGSPRSLLSTEDGERLPTRPKLGIFIDDEPLKFKKWERVFTLEGFESLTPDQMLHDGMSDTQTIQALDQWMDLLIHLPDRALKDVEIVVIDQFNFSQYLQMKAKHLINRLRSVNTMAWVLETSGVVEPHVYEGTNAVLDALDTTQAIDLVEDAPLTLSARIQAFKIFTLTPFLEAQKADTVNDDEKYSPSEGLNKLISHRKFNEALAAIGISEREFFSILALKRDDDLRPIVHDLGNLMGHMILDHGDEYYTMSVDKLRRLLRR